MSINKTLAFAALAGLMSANFSVPAFAADSNAAMVKETTKEKHACKGLNSCAGNSPDGKNACKGHSSCATDKEASGDAKEKNACKGKNSCATDGGK